jgi:signal transduction histidine kinase
MAEDDGIGIEPEKIAKSRSMGIAAIQSKINYFGGRIAFDNIEPSGLLITIEIPVIND